MKRRAMCRGQGRREEVSGRDDFAGDFTDGFFDDHWVVEVWDDRRGWRIWSISTPAIAVPRRARNWATPSKAPIPRCSGTRGRRPQARSRSVPGTRGGALVVHG